MLHPIYTCPPISREIALSGKLDDPLWQRAEAVELTHPVNGASYDQRATARLLYSAEYLYIGFACADDYIVASYTEHDASVWEEGCCEVFLCPSGRYRNYYELNVSPRNTTFDTFILNGRSLDDDTWQHITSFVDFTCASMETRAFVDGELGVLGGARGWSAEYAIPFAALIGADHLTPVPGDEWKMNLCHIASAKSPAPAQFYSWATVGKIDFHCPWTFGTLRFS